MKRKRNDATRTCLGCRVKRERGEMIRIVRDPAGRAVFDIDARLPGRGAYVCPLPSCVKRLTTSALSHHLRAPVVLPEVRQLVEDLAAACETRVRNLITIGLKSGQVCAGASSAEEALRRGRASLLLLALDAAARSERRLLRAAADVPVVKVTDKTRLGSWLGRFSSACAVITNPGLARRLSGLLERLTSIEETSYYSNQA